MSFGNSNKKSQDAMKQLGNAPNTAYENAKAEYFNANGTPRVESSRLFVITIILLVIIVLLGLKIYDTPPPKMVPYMIALSRDKGVEAKVIEAESFTPNDNIKQFILARFIEDMRTLDPYTTRNGLKSAYKLTRDKAITEFENYLNTEKPVQRITSDPNLVRTVKFITINPGTDTQKIAFIRVREEEKTSDKSSVKTHMFTVHYDIIPPQTKEDILVNPTGIFITHFDRREETEAN